VLLNLNEKRECGGDDKGDEGCKKRRFGSDTATVKRIQLRENLNSPLEKGLAVAYHAERSPSRIILVSVCHSGVIKVAQQAGKTLRLSPSTLVFFLFILASKCLITAMK
jgi:hypothetical protein